MSPIEVEYDDDGGDVDANVDENDKDEDGLEQDTWPVGNILSLWSLSEET